jgi:hypothetical protein
VDASEAFRDEHHRSGRLDRCGLVEKQEDPPTLLEDVPSHRLKQIDHRGPVRSERKIGRDEQRHPVSISVQSDLMRFLELSTQVSRIPELYRRSRGEGAPLSPAAKLALGPQPVQQLLLDAYSFQDWRPGAIRGRSAGLSTSLPTKFADRSTVSDR